MEKPNFLGVNRQKLFFAVTSLNILQEVVHEVTPAAARYHYGRASPTKAEEPTP